MSADGLIMPCLRYKITRRPPGLSRGAIVSAVQLSGLPVVRWWRDRARHCFYICIPYTASGTASMVNELFTALGLEFTFSLDYRTPDGRLRAYVCRPWKDRR